MNINVIDILGFITAFQLIFLIVFLLTYKKGNAVSKRILIAFLSANALFIMLFLGFHTGFLRNLRYPPLSIFHASLYLVMAQLLYFYTKALGNPSFVWTKKHFVHAIPVFVLLVFAFTATHLWPSLLVSRPVTLFRRGFLHGILFLYLVYTALVIRRYREDLRLHFSNLKQVNVAWLNLLLAAFAFMWFVDIIIIIVNVLRLNIGTGLDVLFVLSLLINLYFATSLVFWGLRKSELYTGIDIVYKSKPSEINKDQEKRYLGRLREVMTTEKPFLNPLLSIHDLAEKTGIPVRHLSRVINESLDQNFFDFISDYRIDEAKRRLVDPSFENLTVLGILYDVGFNSKSSFNLLFKKKTGLTPTQFKQIHKNQ